MVERIAGALVLVLAWIHAAPASAGSVPIGIGIGTWDVPVDSLKTMRFRSVVAQQYDFSCGSAALATLLTYHYGRPTPETEAFDGMFKVGDQEKIRAQGFSMLDMKRYLETRHALAADGFRVSMKEFEALGVPAIAMIETRGYRHFVVVKGMEDGRVLVGDPAHGLRTYSQREFERLRVNDILFIIRDELDVAKGSFNSTRSWRAVTRSPVEGAVARDGLSDLILHLPGDGVW